MNCSSGALRVLAGACFSVCWLGLGGIAGAQTNRVAEKGNEHPWYLSPSMGMVDFEGDQEFRDAFLLGVRLGYDASERWTVEADLGLAPYVEESDVRGRYAHDWNSTFMLSLSVDLLFHFTRWDRLDPYLAAGIGANLYGEDPEEGSSADWLMRAGGGVMYHFNDEWAARADYRAMLAGFGDNPNANAFISAGAVWTWGARVPPNPVAQGATDSDGDGLSDREESALGTDPYDPDTDDDRLSDGSEVNMYRTDPLNKDTDWDGLTDGDEVLTHSTEPLKRDTDAGGVADGHEVIEDRTNPLNRADDLMLFELYIQFDYDKAVIKPEFNPQLDVVGKVMSRHPGSTARIEGHADRSRKSGLLHNKRLSTQRAQSVLEYLAGSAKIARERMTAVGYGYSRPKAANDPVKGNPLNRRVEVYLAGVSEVKPSPASMPDAAPLAPIPADK